ncbi:MAG: hypothetical protein M3P18_11700 [Actinomycetota bacterium]|nr:hypothetical protein [Actinomycetota bacterium]
MNIERAYTCGFYLPGHDVHWIQAKLAGMYVFNLGAASSVTSERDPMPDTNRQAVPGHLLEVQPDGLVVVEVDGVVRRLWNHDPDRLQQLVARNHGEISHQPGLLRTRSDDGSYLFCVADADNPDLRPCPVHPLTKSPVELLRKAGGFSMPGPEALRWADSAREK